LACFSLKDPGPRATFFKNITIDISAKCPQGIMTHPRPERRPPAGTGGPWVNRPEGFPRAPCKLAVEQRGHVDHCACAVRLGKTIKAWTLAFGAARVPGEVPLIVRPFAGSRKRSSCFY
jgi:hypothetical protein